MFNSTISMLRVRNARQSQRFYEDRLGFRTTWEHDPGDGYPVFLEVSRDSVAFHLSEHAGDGPLAVQVYVNVADARKLFEELIGRGVTHLEAPEEAEWGELTFTLTDPDGNVLRFGSAIESSS